MCKKEQKTKEQIKKCQEALETQKNMQMQQGCKSVSFPLLSSCFYHILLRKKSVKLHYKQKNKVVNILFFAESCRELRRI